MFLSSGNQKNTPGLSATDFLGCSLRSQISAEKSRRIQKPTENNVLNSPVEDSALSIRNENDDNDIDNGRESAELHLTSAFLSKNKESDIFLYALIHRLCFPSNRTQSYFQDKLLSKITTGRLLFQAKDIDNFVNEYYNSLVPIENILCPHCYATTSTKSFCDNETCEFFRVPFQRNGKHDCIVLTSYSIEEQIKNVLRNHGVSILKRHLKYHKDCDSDDYGSEKFKEKMETCDEFHSGVIYLQVSLSFDSFTPSRISKSAFLPFYLRLEDLDEKDRFDVRNLLLAAFFKGKPKRSHLDRSFHRLEEQIYHLEKFGFRIVLDNVSWKFKVRIYGGFADLLGLREVLGAPNYSNIYGCGQCDGKGTRKDRVVLHNSVGVARTPESCRILAAQKVEGFENSSIWMAIITPADFPVDELHTCFEGTIKSCLQDLCTTTKPSFPERKLTLSVRKELESAVARTMNYTYDTKYLLPPSQLSNSTAMEVKRLSSVVLSIVPYFNLLPTEISVHTLGLLVLSSFPTSDSSAELGLLLSDLHKFVNQESFTIKHHMFYYHLAENARRFGTKNLTTAQFEKAHRSFQSELSQYNTHGDFEGQKRFLAKGHFTSYAIKNSTDSDILELLNRNDRASRFPVEEIIDNDCSIPTQSSVKTMKPSHRDFLKKQNIIRGLFRSRILVRNVIFASASYWRANGRSAMSNIVFGLHKFGILELVVVTETFECFVVVQEILTESVKESTSDLLKSVHALKERKATCLRIMEICVEHEMLPRKMTGIGQYKIIPANSIISPFLLVPNYNLCVPISVPKIE